MKDGLDTPIAGVSVGLSGIDSQGNPVLETTTTDSNGVYQFVGLKPGTYTVTEIQPAAFADGPDFAGTAGGTIGADKVTNIVIAPAEIATGYDFLELAPSARIAGQVYVDLNDNGTRDTTESPIASVNVTLTGTTTDGKPVLLTTSTDANGTYEFVGLKPGTYTVTETQPSTYPDGKDTVGRVAGLPVGTLGNDLTSNITLGIGAVGTGYDFGELPPTTAVVSGAVYIDTNNNGTQDPGEPAIPGVTVTLTGTATDGTPITRTVVTDSSGAYEFAGLKPGTYTITETQPPAYGDGKDTPGTAGGTIGPDKITNITLTPGQLSTGNLFGEQPPAATISGTVYNDRNDNGLTETGEPGIPNVTVTLTGTDTTGKTVTNTTLTDSNGAYAFPGLFPGTYTITETQPTTFSDGKDSTGTAGGTTTNDKTTEITLAVNQIGTNYNFGEVTTDAVVSGTVYIDTNNNGTQDPGETGLPGVTITLTGTATDGTPITRTVVTDTTGTYTISDLKPGTYTITETQPPTYGDGKDTAGPLGGTIGPDKITGIVVLPGQQATGNTFGEQPPAASISGTVYNDRNDNGLIETSEPGIPNVTITLTGTDPTGPITKTTTTNADGTYRFDGLFPGTYTITETQPTNWTDGKDTTGTAGGTTTNDKTTGITLAINQIATNYNLGETTPATGVFNGMVYVDTNNNGIQDPDEPGLPGVTITLTGTTTDGTTVTRTVVTDSSGQYIFRDLKPGTYTITETQPVGYRDGKTVVGSAGGTGGPNTITSITLGVGQVATGNSFTELAPVASISGTVFDDRNDDGQQQIAEPGIAGVTVTLTGTDVRGNTINRTTTTNVNGVYTFTGLFPGSYTVSQTQPAIWLDGKDAIGSAGGTLSNDKTSGIEIGDTTTATGYNFGEKAPVVQANTAGSATLTGAAYSDTDNDGVRDPGEPGIAGVIITVTGTSSTGAPVTRTTTTGADGSWTLTDLPPGQYTLTETQPTGYLDGKDTAGSAGGTVGNDTISQITVVAGQTGTGYLFGERPTTGSGSVSGSVFDDRDNDGVQQPGEPGIPGVTITVTGTTTDGQPITRTVVTDAKGSWAIPDLPPGVYTLIETQPSGYTDGKDTASPQGGGIAGEDRITQITLTPGLNATGNTFAEHSVAPVVATPGTGSLSGTVYADQNGNGRRDPGEGGISGVVITITGTTDSGQPVKRTVTTGPDGSWSVVGLAPGTYSVTETQPPSYGDGSVRAGSLGGAIGDNQIREIRVGADANGTGYEFAERGQLITGTIFVDINGDGKRDPGEQPIPGVVVRVLNSSGTEIARVTTGPDGTYSYVASQPGTYRLERELPDGYSAVGATTRDAEVKGIDVVNQDFAAKPVQAGVLAFTGTERGLLVTLITSGALLVVLGAVVASAARRRRYDQTE